MALSRSYPIDQSPLYCLRSKRKLAELIGVPLRDLQFLLRQENYRVWDIEQKRRDFLAGIPPKKSRKIQQPRDLLGAVHKRLAALLARIRKPDFVYSATKARSYVDNAKQHMTADRAVKVDVKNFYPSVKCQAVRDFFEQVLQCAPDVAHFLSLLCCSSGTLPTGSAISPNLSYWACSTMFERVASLAAKKELTFTLYVDDMVFSGRRATPEFAHLVVSELKKFGFVGHKVSCFKPGAVKVITGVAVRADRVEIPHKRQKRIRLFETAFWKAKEPGDIEILGGTLLGQYREGERLQHGSRLRARPVEVRLAALGIIPGATKRRARKPKKDIRLSRSKKMFEQLRSSKQSKPQQGPRLQVPSVVSSEPV